MKIIGTGSAIPKKVVTNDMLSEFLDTSSEWIVPRTGIKSRHVISNEKLEDLAAEAANKALEVSGYKASEIDYFICSNVVNEYVTPSLSCIVSEKIGLTCPCIDINCACPGFIYAMDIAETRYLAGKSKKILVVCAEEPTRMASWKDRSTCVLFGDGAGAVVLGEGDNIKGFSLTSQPNVMKLYQKIILEPTPWIEKEEESIPMQMAGKDVFRFAVTSSIRDMNQVMNDAGIVKEDVSFFLLHQANKRIIDGISHYFDAPIEKFPSNIEDHGNSSSASCSILLDECVKKGLFKSGDKLLFSAFGAGLLSGAMLIEW